MRPAFRCLAAISLLAVAAGSGAATYRLDDSASQVMPPTAQWEWLPGSLRTGSSTVYMDVRVEVRIDTRAWAGRVARIYMVLPAGPGGQVEAQWRTQGVLLGGSLVSGDRRLVYTGPIPGPVLRDTMHVHLTTDSRTMTGDSQPLAFHFELEAP